MWRKLLYLFQVNLIRPKRYRNLLKVIYKNKCKRIMEIGTWNGVHAYQMINIAKIFHSNKDIYYYGFDLFEDFTNKDMEKEFSKKPPSINIVKKRLERTGVNIKLFKGYTQQTLPQFINDFKKKIKLDFIFIDGGHSIETIRSDWNYVKNLMNPKTIVIFDDYYKNEEDFIINKYGCNFVINSLDPSIYKIEILKPEDRFKKEWGTLNVNMVKVTLL
ncbi:MAG: class I SAM-dependent methyltransferase [Promethearchaeia archaeon]